MKNKKVLLALSGGVDSSVAGLLLKKQGYEVIACFMKNFSSKNPLTNECNWISERRMAKRISAILKIPLLTFNFEKEYTNLVLNPMFEAYKKNLTPNPDILCNKIIKFPLLRKKAKEFKCDFIATGHYARIKKTPAGFSLLKGKDKTKDQSYFLSELNQKDLSKTLFPLGNLKKAEVRKIAKKNDFPNYDKKGTSGICFVGKINMHSFLKQKIKEKKGIIKDENKKTIGTHPGIMFFTIGQRIKTSLEINLFITPKTKLFVLEKKKPNTLIVGPKNSPLLKKQKIKIIKFHKINPSEKMPLKLEARIRHLGKLYKGKLKKIKNSRYFIFNHPVKAIAEGQYIVLYNKERVICSGEIRY